MMTSIKFLTVTIFIGLTSAYSQSENPVSWKYSVNETGNGNVKILLDANIKAPWHVYAIKIDGEGPIPTTFTVEKAPGYEIIGDITELTKPIIKFDQGFRFNVGLYAKKATFRQDIKVISDNDVTVTIQVEYQCCNDEICLSPFTETFKIRLPGTKLKVLKNEGKQVVKSSPLVDTIVSTRAENITPMLTNTSGVQKLIFPINNISQSSSLLFFLVIAFFAGLAAILTPCVFPMIPMTISFFMRGSENRIKAVSKGLVFGLSMILLYTGLGVLVSLTGMDANIGNMLSTHWIPNLLFFLLFMIFALSFLGLFELVLPSGIINKADKQADKGGYLGAFFMGVTTVLVSFSCTGPIAGSLLIEAASGEVIKPILGMFFFSFAFALPFTFLAIFPSLLKNLPRSGGWLNSIKVVLGFLLLAFGMKFLSNMDQSYHLGIFSREVYLGIWFVISIILGLYLLGKLKFAHDSDVPFISVPRLVLALASFTFSVYLFTGILGADLYSISSLIPPKSAQRFMLNPAKDQTLANVNWCGPGKYDDLFELSNELNGYFNYEDGLACAKQKQKAIFLDFTGHSCSNCKQMESLVWPDPAVISKLRRDFVIISLYTDDKTKLPENEWIKRADGKVLKTIGDINKYFEIDRFNSIATPLYVLLDPEGNLLVTPKGKDLDPKNFAGFLQNGIDEFNKRNQKE